MTSRRRQWVFASWLLTTGACGPEAAAVRSLEGTYSSEGSDVCKHRHPEAIPSVLVGWGSPTIEQTEDGIFALPQLGVEPPCPYWGEFDGDRLAIVGEDCSYDVAAEPRWMIDAYTKDFFDIGGTVEWQDEILRMTLEYGFRYTSIPMDSLPEWWDEPGSCTTRITMTPEE